MSEVAEDAITKAAEAYGTLVDRFGASKEMPPPEFVEGPHNDLFHKMGIAAGRIAEETNWPPVRFRRLVRCGDEIGVLYQADLSRLERCAAFLTFMADAVEEIDGDINDVLAATIVSEAFRKANGDEGTARNFWSELDPDLNESPASATNKGESGVAMAALYSHIAQRTKFEWQEVPERVVTAFRNSANAT